MILRPPISTRTDTLFPYTPLFRSGGKAGCSQVLQLADDDDVEQHILRRPSLFDAHWGDSAASDFIRYRAGQLQGHSNAPGLHHPWREGHALPGICGQHWTAEARMARGSEIFLTDRKSVVEGTSV